MNYVIREAMDEKRYRKGEMELGRNERVQSHYGYVIVAAAFVMMIVIWGAYSTFGIFFEPLIREFGWTRAMTSGASAINNIALGIICIFSAGLSERFGPRRVITLCGILLGLSYFLMAQITRIWELYLYFGVLMALGMSPFIPLLSLVPKWFKTNRGRMNAIVLSGMGLGFMVTPPIASDLISEFRWRNSYLIIAIATLIISLTASQFLREGPEASVSAVPSEERESGLTLRQAVRTRDFAFLCTLYFLFLFCMVAVNVHIVIHARGLKMSPSHSAYTLSLIGLVCILGMNVMGNFADRFGNRIAMGLSYALMGLSFVWVIPAKSEWSVYLFSIAFGFSYGGMQVLFSPIVAQLFGTRSHGVILGTSLLIGTFGGALGPIVTGYSFDALGSYTPAFTLCAVLSFAGVGAALLLREKVPG
jgi:MFS family permease